jgi:hypothetical protein
MTCLEVYPHLCSHPLRQNANTSRLPQQSHSYFLRHYYHTQNHTGKQHGNIATTHSNSPLSALSSTSATKFQYSDSHRNVFQAYWHGRPRIKAHSTGRSDTARAVPTWRRPHGGVRAGGRHFPIVTSLPSALRVTDTTASCIASERLKRRFCSGLAVAGGWVCKRAFLGRYSSRHEDVRRRACPRTNRCDAKSHLAQFLSFRSILRSFILVHNQNGMMLPLVT